MKIHSLLLASLVTSLENNHKQAISQDGKRIISAVAKNGEFIAALTEGDSGTVVICESLSELEQVFDSMLQPGDEPVDIDHTRIG